MQPTEKDAERILFETLNKKVETIKRFNTGLANYVFDVVTTEHEKLVIRLGTTESKESFARALHWYPILREKKVPLATLYFGSVESKFPVMIMERLEGVDLGDVYSELTKPEKENLATQMVTIQREVASLPEGSGYGYERSTEYSSLHPKWIDVLHANLARSNKRAKEHDLSEYVQQVKELIDAHGEYFNSVRPLCFLDDTTTKNVIIGNGKLSGIVDIDGVAYGDFLLTIALTHTSLISSGYDTHYTEYWLKELGLNDDQKRAFDLYVQMFCLDILSESGNVFNTDTKVTICPPSATRLLNHLKAGI